MTPGQQMIGFLISPVVTMLVVLLGVFWNNRHVDTRISDLQRAMDARFNAIDRRFEDQEKLFTEKLLRVGQIVDARLARMEDKLGVR